MLANVLTTLYSAAAAAAPGAAELAHKKIEPTGLDKLGGVAALLIAITAGVVLLAMALWMIYKALTQSQSLQTSWNPPQEAQFESFAKVETEVHGKSWMFAFGGALLVAAVAMGIYFGVTPQKDKAGDSMDMSTFDKKAKAPAPGPTP